MSNLQSGENRQGHIGLRGGRDSRGTIDPFSDQTKDAIQPSTTSKSGQPHPGPHLAIARCEHDHSTQKSHSSNDVELSVNKLPPELLSLIFKNCQTWWGTDVILPGSHGFPWVIGQVCSLWRQVLWTIGDIWSGIRIRSSLVLGVQETLPSILHQLMTQFHGLVSLEVPVLEIGVFTKLMAPCSGRLRSLRLTLSFDLLGIFLNLPLNYLAALESLDVAIAKAPLVLPVMTRQTNALREAPHLDSFSISYPYQIKRLGPIYSPSGLWLPWSQLTFLHCRGAHSIADVHTVLSQCVALVECVVVVRPFHAEDTTDGHRLPIALPHLRTFTFSPFSGDVDWAMFLEPFVLPSLDGLGCDNWALEPFRALVSRSKCCLRELECFMEASFADPFDVNDLCGFLRMLPSLVLLSTIALPPVFDLISRGELLPHIATLNCSVEIDGLDAFLDLMEKFPPGKGIQSAYISLYHELNEADEVNRRFISVCDQFLEEGRDITMEIFAD
ncbi:hypothetical protein BDZ94DRAFT_1324715 [Collybia nuda]|uniref:F-box domain-containing protein n=1 Tax=Collybia nuda TaxID=64659 RepID=A0A9P5XZB9_9AGAR|nr:hypothetical protein BDZ94DRAFT_1324715 [Collybia nuda]